MDKVSPAERSRIMAQVRSRGNKSTELKLIALLRANNLSGWRRNYQLSGKPDFVYPRHRLALFVDGCFWHGCSKHCRLPATNKKYWIDKIDRNKRRDRKTGKALRAKGWTVIRIWEHDLKSKASFNRKLRRIQEALRSPGLSRQ